MPGGVHAATVELSDSREFPPPVILTRTEISMPFYPLRRTTGFHNKIPDEIVPDLVVFLNGFVRTHPQSYGTVHTGFKVCFGLLRSLKNRLFPGFHFLLCQPG